MTLEEAQVAKYHAICEKLHLGPDDHMLEIGCGWGGFAIPAVALIQTIAIPDERFERYRRAPDWIQQYVFPGSLIPSLGAVSRAVGRSRLMIVGLEEIGISYAGTSARGGPTSTRASTRCVLSATTSASCGSGASTSRTARRPSASVRCATCRSSELASRAGWNPAPTTARPERRRPVRARPLRTEARETLALECRVLVGAGFHPARPG